MYCYLKYKKTVQQHFKKNFIFKKRNTHVR